MTASFEPEPLDGAEMNLACEMQRHRQWTPGLVLMQVRGLGNGADHEQTPP